MNQRLKGILIMLPLLSVFFLGDIVFTIFSLILGVIAYHELCDTFQKKDIHISQIAGVIVPATLAIVSFTEIDKATIYAVIVGAFIGLVWRLLEEKINLIDLAMTIFSLLYAFIPFWLISRIYVTDGAKYAGLIFVVSFSTDICALLFGKCFGKHKLIPNISPKKTIEGSIGGILGSFVLSFFYSCLTSIPFNQIIIISIIGSIVSQIGDLFASSIKRYCGIKDFSNLIPGHGGVLDRFDSVIFVTLLAIVFPIM